jgi:UDP-glucuronate 4-epimerase
LEAALGVKAVRHLKPMQLGDVSATFANVAKLAALTGYSPKITLETGLARFVDWYKAAGH